MTIIYSDTDPRETFRGIDMSKINPNNLYKKHLTNWFYLKFLLAKGTTWEKLQATKELLICERKMAFWYKHPSFSVAQAGNDVSALKKQWTTNDYQPEIPNVRK
jgi:hypothetical protein